MKLMKIALLALAALSLFLAGGCSIFSAQPASPPAAAPAAKAKSSPPVGTVSKSPPPAQTAAQAPAPAPVGRYYDFDDIQVPNQLKLDTKRSLVFRAGKFKAGVLVFCDNLEVQSLINFFVDAMQKDNWTLLGSYKYPKVMLFFAKPGRTCVIDIEEGTFSTDVTIWVAPSQ